MQRSALSLTIFAFLFFAGFSVQPHPAAAENDGGWLSQLLNGTGPLWRKPSSRRQSRSRRKPVNRRLRSIRATPALSSRKRVMCVRTCDGFYFPIAFGVTLRKAGKLGNICQDRCSAPTKLYVHSVLESAQSMVTLDGARYVNEEYANLYRTKRVAGCDCQAKPWSETARLRHKRYAINDRVISPPLPERRKINRSHRPQQSSTAISSSQVIFQAAYPNKPIR